MSTDQSNQPASSDEIDLGKFFNLIGQGFNRIGIWILSAYLYFRRNLLWLAGLLIVGVAGGFLLKTLLIQQQKIDVIVTPQMNNSDYLQDVVSEIQADIKAKDSAFFKSLQMDISKMEGFEIQLTPLREAKANAGSYDAEFLELLKEFGESEAAEEIIRSELQDRTTRDHRITFYFKDPAFGREYAQKLIAYINSNEYYQKLNTVVRENALERIQRNDSLIVQIDVLIQKYTEQMSRENTTPAGSLVLENQEPLNIPSLFTLKNQLIRDSEEKRLELIRREDAIRIVNFGKAHEVQKPLFGKWIVLLPLILIGIFFLISFLKYLNHKANQIQTES